MTTDEIGIDIEGVTWEKPHFYLNGEVFVPKIYIGQEKEIPSGYNTVLVKIDGQVSADLFWKDERDRALDFVERGLQILWKLDLGLFKELPQSMTNQTQILSLLLSLEHFRDTLFKEFKNHTLGICLYQGSADFSRAINWDQLLEDNFLEKGYVGSDNWMKKLFCRDVVAEYLSYFSNRMPDEMQVFVDLVVDDSLSIAQELQLTHRERFDRIHVTVIESKIPQFEDSKIGICLPSFERVDPNFYEQVEMLLKDLMSKGSAFKIIPETYLMIEWDSLDYIIVPKDLSTQAQRQLKGFEAAGGKVASIDEACILLNHSI